MIAYLLEDLPLPEDDPKYRRPDIKKAKELLDWEPKFPRKKGLELTLDYFKKVVTDLHKL